MQDTTAQRMAVFTATLADVRLALGQAFLPVLHVVLPILTTLANALIKVLQVFGAFMQALFGKGFKFKPPVSSGDVKNTQNQAKALDGVGKSADKAGKKSAKAGTKAKKAWSGTFGFDEVHTIKDPEPAGDAGGGAGGGGGGAGGGGGLGGLDTSALDMGNPFEAFTEGMSELAGKFKKYTDPIKKIASQIWTAVSTYAIEKFNQISAWWAENGVQITQAMKNVWNFLMPIVTFVVKYIWDSVKGLIDGVITFFQGITEFFTGIFTGDWTMAWEGLKKIFIGAFQAIWNFTNLTFIGGLRKGIVNLALNMGKSIKGFVDDGIKFFQNFWKNIGTILGNIRKFFKGVVDDLRKWWDDLVKKLTNKWETFKKDVHTKAIEAVSKLKEAFNGVVGWFGRVIITPLVNKFNEIKEGFKGGAISGLKAVLNTMIAPLNEVIGVFNSIKNKIPLASALPNVPKIPRFAQGGITSGPMLAMVGDNPGGKEVIAPLDRLQSMLTASVIQAIQGAGGGQTGDVILNIDGRTFARIVKPFLDKEQSRIGQDIRIKTI